MSYLPLSELCDINMGQSPSSDSYNEECIGLPFFQGNADFGEIHPCPRVWCSDPKKTASKGDILISVRAPIGAINLANTTCCIGRGIASIRAKEGISHAGFIAQYLGWSRLKLEKLGTGSTFKAINKCALTSFPVPAHSVSAQSSIYAKLDHCDRTISLSKRTLNQLDSLIKSRFAEMFGGCETKVELNAVSELLNGDRGKNYPSKEDRIEMGVPFVNASHLLNGRVSFEEMDYITEERYELLSGGKVRYGDILYCLRGSLGKCAIADFSKGAIASSMMIIRPNQEQILPVYLYYVLVSQEITMQLESARNGSSQPNLSAKNVGGYLIPLPCLDLQRRFSLFTEQVDKLRFDVQRQIEKLDLLKQSLMQEYFG